MTDKTEEEKATPKRVIDFEAMWASDKLAACAEWAQAEYAWIYGLADANGSFELTNLRVIWGRVAAIRKNLSLERLEQVFGEFHDKGLLFIWEENGKRYGHWTNSDLPGRLPSPSWRKRLERLAPPVPREALVAYMSRFARKEVAAPVKVNIKGERHGYDGGPTEGLPAANLKPSFEPAQAQKGDWDRDKDLSSLTGAPQEMRPECAEGVSPPHEGCDPRVLLEVYEQERGELPPVRAWTAQRLSKCRARLSQSGFLPEDFRAAVRKASRTPFLCGASPRGWRASFDWFIANDTNYLKVLEGRYDPPSSLSAPNYPSLPRLMRAAFQGNAAVEVHVGRGPSLAGARVKPAFLEKWQAREEALRRGTTADRRGSGVQGLATDPKQSPL